MRLPNDLHEMQNAEITVSAKPQNQPHEPLRGDGMTVTHQRRDELCPSNNLPRVHAALVLTKLDGPLAAHRGVGEIRQVVGHVAIVHGIEQGNGVAVVELERFGDGEGAIWEGELDVGARWHGPVGVGAVVRVERLDLVLEDGHQLGEVLEALVAEAVGAVSGVHVQARGAVDFDVELCSDEADDPADLLEALLADWEDAGDELDTGEGDFVADVVFEVLVVAVAVRMDGWVVVDLPDGITCVVGVERTVNSHAFSLQVFAKLLADGRLVEILTSILWRDVPDEEFQFDSKSWVS